MGWISYHVEPTYKKGKPFIDRKAECGNLFNSDAVSWETNGTIGKYEVLKSSMVGSTYYAAVRKTIFATETEHEDVKVFAAVVLTNVNNNDYFNFAYKDMDETYGPCEDNCPKGILDLLTPTDSEYANDWRKRCYENLKKKRDPNALGNLPIGSIIKYKRYNGEEMTLVKCAPAYQFKRPWWKIAEEHKYISAKYIPSNYVVIKKGE